MSHQTQNTSFWRRSSQPISWLRTEKLNLTRQKQAGVHNKIYYNTPNKHKHLKPGLGASYDLRHGNAMGPILKAVNK